MSVLLRRSFTGGIAGSLGIGSRLAALVVLIGSATAASARADQLVMPYGCAVENGRVRLSPSSETAHQLIGSREERPFSVCRRGGNGDCTTAMVHRFSIQCGAETVSWARVAAAGRDIGIFPPLGMPAGFAPVSDLKGRFVLPALVRFGSGGSEAVARQDLSPDGVINRYGDSDAEVSHGPAWQTIVRAEFRPEATFTAMRVAAIATALLGLMLTACMFAAGHRPDPVRFTRHMPSIFRKAVFLLGELAAPLARQMHRSFSFEHLVSQRGRAAEDITTVNALAIANAHLAETELLIATLPRERLLREVLQSETDKVRTRLATIADDAGRIAPQKFAAAVRTVLRELERIARIAHGALQDSAARPRDAFDMPESTHEAYELLGINADAAPAVAKKLVDALRMSWHPDFARNDDDRLLREERMKQINRAWDLIKEQRQVA